ncbi:MAG TPA: hypothetical protein VK776_23995 [Bryobacteraceae bacterium]|jgi:hypothetical protein|nr:hypothetical protein [Bryobacteraceae bacterium]
MRHAPFLCAAIFFAVLPLTAQSQPDASDVTVLKAQLAEQQKQIDQLKLALEEQKKLIERSLKTTANEDKREFALPRDKALGEVASTTPYIPPAPAPAPLATPVVSASAAQAPTTPPANPCEAVPDGPAPAFIRLGSTCLVPIGFMDLTSVWRDKNAGSSMGSNFGSIPFNNTVNGNLSEFRFTPQNSRIGFRFDGDWKGTHFIGYNEFDFNGTSGSNGIAVSNGAFVPRLRLYWVDVRKGKIEFLAGQSWSLLTPNRTGLSALPGNLFYTQVIDINYMAGLTWTRQPGMRVLFHPSEKVTFGVSAENPDQYAGGSAGGSTITYPAAFASLANAQLDISQNVSNGQNILTQPTVAPDIIAKLALDPSSRFHFEVGGVERNFKIVNPSLLTQHFSATGAGLLAGLNAEVFKNFRLISTNYWSDGGGRYLFGQAPDLIVRANGTLSLVHSGGTIDGFEARTWKNNLLLYAYYGGIYIGRDVAIDTNGSKVGYGYTGSPNSQNRNIQEITFGFNQTIWANPRYGAINAMGQYEWLNRDPWFVALGAPKATHDNTIYFNLRYTLPGSMPPF